MIRKGKEVTKVAARTGDYANGEQPNLLPTGLPAMTTRTFRLIARFRKDDRCAPTGQALR
jgi:hypothetical protein